MELTSDNKLKKIISVGDRVLIKPTKDPQKTDSGIYLPPGVQEKEKVPLSVATQYAKEISAPYGNTSAKEDIGVNDIFVKIARKLHRMHVAPLDDERRESVVVDGRRGKLKNGSKKGKCC